MKSPKYVLVPGERKVFTKKLFDKKVKVTYTIKDHAVDAYRKRNKNRLPIGIYPAAEVENDKQ